MSSVFSNLGQDRHDPHEDEARAALRRLRKSFDRLFQLRALNELAMRGQDRTCRFSAEEMRERVAVFRDLEMEQRFRQEMFRLMKTIYRRDPTQLEVQAGPPSGDGTGLSLTLAGVGSLVAGVAWGLSSITNYLAEREGLARGDVENGQPMLARAAKAGAKGLVIAALVGGASYGVYRLWKWSRKPATTAELEAPEESADDLETLLRALREERAGTGTKEEAEEEEPLGPEKKEEETSEPPAPPTPVV